ncbi:hypothetical protein QGM61_00310 [Pseudohongiella sp. SYSU M77423]|uniref:hypothetical protein n=1 Tax=unclassified Pseudohongiella TaxID=2629611 RepID=UPI001F25D958|nr:MULTISPECIES: hypothetical protein [unclassified Pseudohongiella]MDH7942248.1 hypothetical protein [Pseudohongiella sp. SYSU M77423]MEC8859434.1 hypothetical protein [Pseudomonadota bacterium]
MPGKLLCSAMAICLYLPSAAFAQFDGELVFDDSAFQDDDLFSSVDDANDNFRFRLSHQVVAHINRHQRQLPDGTTDTRARGLENNRTALNIRYQNPFRAGWLLQGSAQLRAYLPGDYEYNNPTRDDWEWRLNELFVQRSGERNSFSFGRQTIVWGETIGNSVLDVINTTEYRDLTIIDIEDARLNQWLGIWDHFSQAGNWSSFVNLYPEFNPVPVQDSPLFPGAPFRLGHYHRDKPLFEAGTRWNRSFTGSDVAIMAARLYENPLQYTPPTGGDGRAQVHINDYNLLGLSANRAIGMLLLTLDVAYSQGVLASVAEADGQPALSTGDLWGVSTGLEYGISATQQISAGLRIEQLNQVDTSAGQSVTDSRHSARSDLLVRYSNRLMNEELTLSATLQSQLDGDAGLLNLAADYRLNDDWELRAQLILTHAEEDNELAFLDEDVRAGLTLSWSF